MPNQYSQIVLKEFDAGFWVILWDKKSPNLDHHYYTVLPVLYDLIQKSPAVKKVCCHQEGHCEKRCEIQGGGQEWL